MFSILEGSFKSFENHTVELLANETKWASLEVRTHPTFLETLISKYDSGPVKLPGLWRNGPQGGTYPPKKYQVPPPGVYLDEFYGAECPSLADNAFATLQSIFDTLGLASSPEKDSPPAFVMVSLGILVNS